MQALSGGALDIPGLLAGFRDSHPMLEVHLRYAAKGSVELAEQLRDSQLDIAILSLPDRQPARHLDDAVGPRADGARLCAGAPAGEGEIDPDLRTRRRVVHRPPRGMGHSRRIDQSFATAGVWRQVAYEVGDTPSVVNLVRHSFGVAFLPPSILPPGENVRLVPVRDNGPQWEIALALPSNRPVTAAARAFADAATHVDSDQPQ